MLKAVAGAHVVAWENVSPSQTAQEDILGAPTPHAAKLFQALHSHIIWKGRELVQVYLTLGD
jgi:hypothetical protein